MDIFQDTKAFVYVDGQQFFVLDRPVEAGDFFIDTRNNTYAICDDVQGDNVINNCQCGHCSMSDRTSPRNKCKAIIPVNTALN